MMRPRRNPSSSGRPSVTDQLGLLRAVVGGNSSFSESDLWQCLSQSNYDVSLAADRILSGQFPPAKRARHAPLTSNPKPPPPPSSSSYESAVASNAASATGSSAIITPTAARTNTGPRKQAKLTQSIFAPTPSTSFSRKNPVAKKPSAKPPPVSVEDSWLLCHRWISNGMCTQRNGAIQGKEALATESSSNGAPMLWFHGTNIRGQLPKPLARMLCPLLRHKAGKEPLIILQVEGQRAMNHLLVGSNVALSIRIWLPNPEAFFQIFDSNRYGSVSATSLFFRKQAKQTKSAATRAKPVPVQDAAFELLQWAQYGDQFSSHVPKKAEETADFEEVKDDGAPAETDEETPEWAKSVTAESNTSLPETPGPANLKVTLRDYQSQALSWMIQQEQERKSDDMREQLALLAELAKAQAPSRPLAAAFSDQPIICHNSPVLVSDDLSNQTESVDGQNAEKARVSHPLWERRYLANHDMTQARCFFVQPLFGSATATPPKPPMPCRGGILADSMGLGKTVMLLSLIGKSKEAREATRSRTPETTLVVGPLSILAQWEEELRTKTTLTYAVHYGDKRSSSQYGKVDVVITSYGTLQAELRSYLRLKEMQPGLALSGFLARHWKRVILDEAHFIKNPATLASKACCLLQADCRWCVSGTIIQNSLDDLHALLKFLQHEPWCARSFWEASISNVDDMAIALDRARRLLQPIMLRRTKASLDKNGNPILTLPPVDTRIVRVDFSPAERHFYAALHKKSLRIFEGYIEQGTASKSYMQIFSLLQRLRQACDHVVLILKSLVGEEDWENHISTGNAEEAALVEDSPLDGDGVEQDFLKGLMDSFRDMQGSTGKENESNVKEATYASQVATAVNKAIKSNSTQLEDVCCICLDNIEINNAVITPCLHVFCRDCLVTALNESKKQSENGETTFVGTIARLWRCPDGPCPVCKTEIAATKILKLHQNSEGQTTTSFLTEGKAYHTTHGRVPESEAVNEPRQVLQDFIRGTSSAKLNAIISELHEVWKEAPRSKVLIFSQFLGFLDLLGQDLRKNGIPFGRLDGKLSLAQRKVVLEEFGQMQQSVAFAKDDGEESDASRIGSVLLISMKAGGVGLNLTAASSVFIADPWWHQAWKTSA